MGRSIAGAITMWPSKSVLDFIYTLYFFSGKRKRRVDDAAVAEVTKKLAECHLSVSDISLEVRMYLWNVVFCNIVAFTVYSRDDTVVGALASHQCGPGLIPNLCIIHGGCVGCWFSLFQVVFLRVHFSPLHQKPAFPNSSGCSQWAHSVLNTLMHQYSNSFYFSLFFLSNKLIGGSTCTIQGSNQVLG